MASLFQSYSFQTPLGLPENKVHFSFFGPARIPSFQLKLCSLPYKTIIQPRMDIYEQQLEKDTQK